MSAPPHLSLIEKLLPVALLVGIILIAVLTLYPFLPAILWAIMLAIALEPAYAKLVKWSNGRRLLMIWLMGIGVMLAIIIPAIGLARTLVAFLPEALTHVERLATYSANVGPGSMHEVPAVGPYLGSVWEALRSDARSLASNYSDEIKAVLVWLLQEAKLLGVFIFEFAVGVILAMVLVYRSDRVSMLAVKFFDKIGGAFASRLAAHSVVTTRLAVLGVLGAALAQTLVATFSYVVAGVPGWIVWAGVTFVLSLIQIGPVLVWLPMTVWLWLQDQPYMALFVFSWGLVVVNLTDNILRPLLVSKNTAMPTSLAFLGALGGLMQWGVVGVFLGPVIVAVGYELVLKWVEPDTLPEDTLVNTTDG